MNNERENSWKRDRYSSERYHRDGDRREWNNHRGESRFRSRREESDSYDRPAEGRSEENWENRRKGFRDRRDSRREEGFRDRKEFRRDDRPREERRPYRRDYENDRGERRSFSDRKPRTWEKKRYLEDSPILDEIIRKRRSEGRAYERRPKVLSLEWNEDRGLIRLNKYIANAGVCSRRDADLLIESGQVTVNGEVVTELGTKIMHTDVVCYGDKVLQKEKPVYILLNKPKDYITTTSDEYDRKNVMNLVAGACPQRVYPVGRLDRNTTGLLLITNDGELAKKLTHPRYGVKKIYQVELDKNLSQEDFQLIISGLELKDGFIAPDELAYVGESRREIGITLHSGKNRIVRRIFEHLGYEVVKLDRVYYAGLTKKDLPRGQWRFLRQDEVNILKMSL